MCPPMVLAEIRILFLVSWVSMVSCFQVDRITDGVDLTPPRGNIYGSEDLFTNKQLYVKDCTKRNSICVTEGCREKTCCRCKCNAGLTFFSYTYGCLTADEIRLKLGRKCRYIFYNQTTPVVPAFKDKSNAARVRIDMRLNELPKMISLKEKHTTCTAGSINEITSTGSTKLLDPNDDSGFFEVQHVYHPRGGYKILTFNGWTYELWAKLEGRLISLEISCFNQSRTFEISSCLLFKVNGTIYCYGCDQIYCIDKASGRCDGSAWYCCTCVCSIDGFPYADQENKKCVSSRVTTATTAVSITSSVATTIQTTASKTHTEVVPSSPTKHPKSKQASSSTREPTTLPLYGTSTDKLANNATFVPVTTKKGTGSVGPIVGGVVGALIIFGIVLALWFYCKKRRKQHGNGSKSNSHEVENGNSRPAYSLENTAEEPLTQTSENPYYDASANPGIEDNEYFDPKVVIKSSANHDGCDIYYSTADAVKNQTEPERVFEYSYARGTAKGADQEHYQPLGQQQHKPGMYQSLDAATGTSVNKAPLEQENPYYTPSTENDGLLEDNVSEEKKGLSLKNNAGSRENVSPTYETVIPDADTTVYQGLTNPSKQNDYDPLQRDEYLDMSFGDKSDGEYMYAST